jgi:predicted Na+-dependent transporter
VRWARLIALHETCERTPPCSSMQQVAYFVPLFLLVFGLSASVDVRQAWQERARFGRGVVCGLLCQFMLLPFLGFCVVKIFDLGEVYGVTLLVVTSSPGGSYSNWWCSLLNADLALSVAMTTASTILSLGLLPLNLIIWVTAAYGTRADQHLKWSGLFLAIGVVLAAIGSGLAAGVAFGDDGAERTTSRGAKARAFFNALGQLSGVALIVVALLVSSRDEPIWNKFPGFYVAVALPCAVGLGLSTLLAAMAKLERPARATVAVECAYQNPGIATVVALSMFDGDQASRAVGVPLYYGFVEAIFIGVYLVFMWKAGWLLAPPDAPIYSVLLWNWQEKSAGVGGDATDEAAAPAPAVVDEAGMTLALARPDDEASDGGDVVAETATEKAASAGGDAGAGAAVGCRPPSR